MENSQKINFASSLISEVIIEMDKEFGYSSIAEQGTIHLNQAYLYQVLDIINKLEM